MPTSDQELEQLRSEVESKRVQLADAQRDREEKERALANDVTAAQLRDESKNLDSQIAEETRRTTVLEGGSQNGASAPVVAQPETKTASRSQSQAATETASQ